MGVIFTCFNFNFFETTPICIANYIFLKCEQAILIFNNPVSINNFIYLYIELSSIVTYLLIFIVCVL